VTRRVQKPRERPPSDAQASFLSLTTLAMTRLLAAVSLALVATPALAQVAVWGQCERSRIREASILPHLPQRWRSGLDRRYVLRVRQRLPIPESVLLSDQSFTQIQVDGRAHVRDTACQGPRQ
jgi:hypothetical protein